MKTTEKEEQQEGQEEHSDVFSLNQSSQEPPDGGCRAYSVMVASFLINGLLFGVVNSCSVMYPVLLKTLEDQNAKNAEMRASLVEVLAIATTFFMSPIAGILTDSLGLQQTAVLGGSIASLALLLSSFLVKHVDCLCFSYGFMYGFGASLAYTPSLAVLGHYFKKRLGAVNGIVTIGSPVFTVFMLPLMDYLITNYGLKLTFRVLSLITIGMALCGLIFKPLLVIEKTKQTGNFCRKLFKTFYNAQLWQKKKYKIWALSIPVALFGYFVPYVHIKKLMETHGISKAKMNIPLQCISITSAVGRLTFGFLADRPRMNRIVIQQVTFYVIGTLTMILPFVRTFELIVVIALGMGLCEGGFIALMGPIAFQLCGSALAAQGIGCMLGLVALPLSAGPPMAGALYSHFGSYKVPFIIAGCTPIIGATLLFGIHLQNRKEGAADNNSNDASKWNLKN